MSFVGEKTVDELTSWRENLTAISLFSGCGGAALGLAQAGYNVRVFVEWEKAACDTLRTNWTEAGRLKWHLHEIDQALKNKDEELYQELQRNMPLPEWVQVPMKNKNFREPAILQADITKLSTEKILEAAGLQIGEASLLEGGFPCQGFSYAGLRLIDDPRNQLYKECVRVIKEALPKSFMLENVPGLISMAKGDVILQICEDLAAVGYNVSWDILNAADYGVPQNRKRVFIIGLRQDAMVFKEEGNHQLHIGAIAGSISYPLWFIEKYRKKNEKVAALEYAPGAYCQVQEEQRKLTIPAL